MARPGVLKSVALAPLSLVRGTVGALGRTASQAPGDGLADQWLDFLIQQAEAGDQGEAVEHGKGQGVPAEALAPFRPLSGRPGSVQVPGRWGDQGEGLQLPRTPRSPSMQAG